MEIDWSVILAAAALIISVLSPLITALLSGVFKLKEKHMEYSFEQVKAIRNYLQRAGEHTFSCMGKSNEYLSAKGEIFLFIPTKYWKDIEEFDAAIGDDKRSSELLFKISKELSSIFRK